MLCVFDKFTQKDKFYTNGERFLFPQRCETVEELNGDWSLSMDYIMNDKDDAWKCLVPFNIIKTDSGELFPIYSVKKKLNSNGLPVLSVKARHIFYYLNDKIARHVDIDKYSAYWAISKIFDNIMWGYGEGLTDYEFEFNSNIPDDKLRTAHFDGESVVYMLLGSPESIVNIYNGELYRHNFYFSINDRMEGCQDNAFNLVHGWNLTEISEEVDYSEYITELEAEDNFGQFLQVSRVPDGSFPHQVKKYLKLSYSTEEEAQNFRTPYGIDEVKDYDTDIYYKEHRDPIVTYEINFQDLRNTNKAADWQDVERLHVGDSGRIYSEMLGISTTQKIISRTVDEITGRVKSVKLGNFKPSALHTSRFDKMENEDDSNARRLDFFESKFQYIPDEEEEEDEEE